MAMMMKYFGPDDGLDDELDDDLDDDYTLALPEYSSRSSAARDFQASPRSTDMALVGDYFEDGISLRLCFVFVIGQK